MTIQQLQYILEVNRTRSITQAAKNLYVTQAGISSAISSLEDELGFRSSPAAGRGLCPLSVAVVCWSRPAAFVSIIASWWVESLQEHAVFALKRASICP